MISGRIVSVKNLEKPNSRGIIAAPDQNHQFHLFTFELKDFSGSVDFEGQKWEVPIELADLKENASVLIEVGKKGELIQSWLQAQPHPHHI